ncbi:unnamed protein product [Prunus armeniaca]
MAMKVLAMLVVMMAVVQDSRAAVNKNGEPTGWTTIDNIDYKKWPATRTFHGDIIKIPTHPQGYGGLKDERGHHEEEVDAIQQYYDHERTIFLTFSRMGITREHEIIHFYTSCPCHMSLSVAEELLDETRCIFPELICKWKNLEELSLGGSYNLVKIIEQIHCKSFYVLTLFESLGRDASMSIVNLFLNIKNPTLMNSQTCRDDFVVILQGCKNLVLLDAKKCKGFNESDEEISKLASHISNFRCEGSIGGDCWGGRVCSYYPLYRQFLNPNGHGGEGVNDPFLNPNYSYYPLMTISYPYKKISK